MSTNPIVLADMGALWGRLDNREAEITQIDEQAGAVYWDSKLYKQKSDEDCVKQYYDLTNLYKKTLEDLNLTEGLSAEWEKTSQGYPRLDFVLMFDGRINGLLEKSRKIVKKVFDEKTIGLYSVAERLIRCLNDKKAETEWIGNQLGNFPWKSGSWESMDDENFIKQYEDLGKLYKEVSRNHELNQGFFEEWKNISLTFDFSDWCPHVESGIHELLIKSGENFKKIFNEKIIFKYSILSHLGNCLNEREEKTAWVRDQMNRISLESSIENVINRGRDQSFLLLLDESAQNYRGILNLFQKWETVSQESYLVDGGDAEWMSNFTERFHALVEESKTNLDGLNNIDDFFLMVQAADSMLAPLPETAGTHDALSPAQTVGEDDAVSLVRTVGDDDDALSLASFMPTSISAGGLPGVPDSSNRSIFSPPAQEEMELFSSFVTDLHGGTDHSNLTDQSSVSPRLERRLNTGNIGSSPVSSPR